MLLALLVASGLIVCFGAVLLRGAPYLPTLTPQVRAALDLIDLESGQTLLELGCGDGKVLAAAAARGLHVVGYELNPLLVLVARLRTWRYRRLVQIHFGDFFTANWPVADGIFVFGLQRLMPKLDTKIVRYSAQHGQPVRLVSFAFTIPSRPIVAQKQGIYLYEY